jgi:GlpG protein
MREAGRFSDATLAQDFSDYLLANGTDNHLEQEADGWVLWVLDDDAVGRVKAERDEFLRDPQARRFRGFGRTAATLRKQEQADAKAAAKLHVDIRKQWRSQASTWRPVTMAFLAVSVIITLLTRFGDQPEPLLVWLTIASYSKQSGFIHWLGLSEVMSGQVWRLVTPIFVHFDPLHLLFNMLWLYSLGNMIEGRRGLVRFLLLVLAIAVSSNLGQYLVAGPAFGGMSGVDYGLLGYAYIKGRYEPHLGMGISRETMIFMLVWLGLGFVGFLSMANGAHLIGLLAGVVIAGVPVLWRGVRR